MQEQMKEQHSIAGSVEAPNFLGEIQEQIWFLRAILLTVQCSPIIGLQGINIVNLIIKI
jgi:hypothetical protein